MSNRVDVLVADIAERQLGLFSDRQVAAVGGDRALRARRVASGRWIRVCRGVLGFPGWAPSFRRSLWASLLAAPDGAMVSHWSAAALHRMVGYPPTRFQICVPHGCHAPNPIAIVRQTTQPAVPFLIDGLPVTPIERTVVDLGSITGPTRLGATFEELVLGGRTTFERTRREFLSLARQGRPGITVLHTVLERADGPGPARSELERALDRIIATLPGRPPAREAPLPGREWSNERVDRCFEDELLIVEGDGRRWHARSAAFTRDRQRDRVAMLAGYRTARYAYEELTGDPDGVRAELLALLGRA
jgi:hypothetical protein